MAKVKDVFPSPPRIVFDTKSMLNVTLADIWANYDAETDSMIIYVTGKPVAGVNVYLNDDVYAIVDTRYNNKVVGLYFDSWKDYIPKFDIVNRSWGEIRNATVHGKDTTLALRVLALDLIMLVSANRLPSLQLA